MNTFHKKNEKIWHIEHIDMVRSTIALKKIANKFCNQESIFSKINCREI